MPDRTSYEPGTPCWVDLGTPGIESSKAFYGGLFGWHARPSDDPAAGGYTIMTLGGEDPRPVAALMPQTVEGQPVAWCTYVSVTDLDATVDAVRGAGGQVLMEPMDVLDQGRMAIFADAVGAVVGAWQPLEFQGAGVVNEPGAYCWSELACRDTETAEEFYRAVFGWEAETSPFGTTIYTEWSNPGGAETAGMLLMDDQWPREIPPHWMVYFAVADCDAAAALAGELGGAVPVPPADLPIGRFAVLSDPQGGHFSVIRLNA
ncbi:VOC family protein [Actinomadura rugatobispora]|uniref:VOC family protein n=1 Tax=Actinomadura rugatobispora TaxID=1994 RepID=A0ABW0ZWX9_9ACTN|nr:VOC family protein [Actinomadura rugatobispora]